MMSSAKAGAVAGSAAVAVLIMGTGAGTAAAASPADNRARVVVLDTTGFWRMHYTLEPPVVQFDDGVKPIVFERNWLDQSTAGPPPEWRSPDFVDRGWVRGPVRLPCRSPFVARHCLRGKFVVTDPKAVRGLTLTVSYHGGAVAYVNGKEFKRGHVPPGGGGKAGPAEAYPSEVFVTRDGNLLSPWQIAIPYRRAKHDEDAE